MGDLAIGNGVDGSLPPEAYETQAVVYRNIFKAFAYSLRNTPGTKEARKRLDVMARFCDWVSEHRVKPKRVSDRMPEWLMDGRWEVYEDIAAMVEYIDNPRAFRERHKKTFDQFLKELKRHI